MKPESKPTVVVVDDDDAVRDALSMLFRTAGLAVETHPSPAHFLRHPPPAAPACLVLDIRMPSMSGLELQQEVQRRAMQLPIIFITGHGDIPMAVRAVKNGAADFLEKPFDNERLLMLVKSALHESRGLESAAGKLSEIALSHRELVLAGKPSRQIASDLFISPKTVEFHRSRIMKKFGVTSMAGLFRACLNQQSAEDQS